MYGMGAALWCMAWKKCHGVWHGSSSGMGAVVAWDPCGVAME